MLTVDRHARDVLRRELATTMSGAGDLSLYAGRAEPPDAGLAPLRRRILIALRLLDDIGWDWRDPRDVFHVTAPAADVRWWVEGQLEGVDEQLRACAFTFHRGGDVWPHEALSRLYPGCSIEESADIELQDARERSDRELDARAVFVALLEQLEGVS